MHRSSFSFGGCFASSGVVSVFFLLTAINWIVLLWFVVFLFSLLFTIFTLSLVLIIDFILLDDFFSECNLLLEDLLICLLLLLFRLGDLSNQVALDGRVIDWQLPLLVLICSVFTYLPIFVVELFKARILINSCFRSKLYLFGVGSEAVLNLFDILFYFVFSASIFLVAYLLGWLTELWLFLDLWNDLNIWWFFHFFNLFAIFPVRRILRRRFSILWLLYLNLFFLNLNNSVVNFLAFLKILWLGFDPNFDRWYLWLRRYLKS